MEQITLLPNATPEQMEAATMHFEIIQAAQVAANSLLDLGRKLKRMRDSGRYKVLGFDSFGAYTEAAVGIKQRQAYNYIQVVESLPAQLIEENAAAGITKLALLAKLNPDDRADLAGGDLAKITVAELQELVKERDELNRQLSLFQQDAQVETVADVEAVAVDPVDPEEIRRQAIEETEARLAKKYGDQLAKAQAATAEAVNAATLKAEKTAAAQIRKAEKQAREDARAETAEAVRKAREDGAREAMAAVADQNTAELERLRASEAQATERAEALAKELQLNSDEDGVRFALLFDQLMEKVDTMRDMATAMVEHGKREMADKYMAALVDGLEAITAQLKEGE